MKLDDYKMREAFRTQDIEGILKGLREHFGIMFDSSSAEIVRDDPHVDNEIILFSTLEYYSWSETEGFTSHDFAHPLSPLLRICFAVQR